MRFAAWWLQKSTGKKGEAAFVLRVVNDFSIPSFVWHMRKTNDKMTIIWFLIKKRFWKKRWRRVLLRQCCGKRVLDPIFRVRHTGVRPRVDEKLRDPRPAPGP